MYSVFNVLWTAVSGVSASRGQAQSIAENFMRQRRGRRRELAHRADY
jgi:hypothetical protein